MSASLVGSEMCIRDRYWELHRLRPAAADLVQRALVAAPLHQPASPRLKPVSYTHLTLPTICSV
eukprot:5042905-Alexandrium_andersonii.AAC.1